MISHNESAENSPGRHWKTIWNFTTPANPGVPSASTVQSIIEMPRLKLYEYFTRPAESRSRFPRAVWQNESARCVQLNPRRRYVMSTFAGIQNADRKRVWYRQTARCVYEPKSAYVRFEHFGGG